ncbi:MAG: hypothetical protein NW206_02835 [Hyphomonadaceae bacterium]|nr:hypothetical protein [Hyphomonadaceae bacterium]
MVDHTPWEKRPPYIQRWRDKRDGTERLYFRKGKAPPIALKMPWGTQALADEVAALTATAKTRPAPAAGTLVGAVKEYRGDRALGMPPSADYLTLSAATQGRYDRWLDEFERVFAGILLSDIDAAYILALRDKWAPRGHEAANTALQVLKNVCKRPIILGSIAGDPFSRIDKVARPQGLGERNPRWEDTEVEAFIAWALERGRPGLARAIALGRWGGFRKQTICRVPLRARIERENGAGDLERRILWMTEKKEVLCDRREDLRLTDLLSTTPNRALTVAYNSQGQPWKPRALSHAVDRAIAILAKAGKVRPVLTIHGLRHARGVEIALAGGSDAEIMAQLDHATPRAAQNYRRQAERLRLADGAQDRVDAEIVRLRDARARKKDAGSA